jgi:hypothetical protein
VNSRREVLLRYLLPFVVVHLSISPLVSRRIDFYDIMVKVIKNISSHSYQRQNAAELDKFWLAWDSGHKKQLAPQSGY